MRTILLLSLGLLSFVPAAGAADNYSQKYTVLIKGVIAGSETVSEKIESGQTVSTSNHEIIVSDGLEAKRMTFSTRMVLTKAGVPVSYSYWYTSGSTGDSYDITVKDGQITRVLNRNGHTNEATAPFRQDMVVVDHNVYHQYDYLVRRYDAKKGGRQTFADFLPLIGSDIPVALTYNGEAKLETASGTLPVKKYSIEFVGILGGSLSVDKDGHLVQLLIPKQDLEVVRTDLLPAAAEP